MSKVGAMKVNVSIEDTLTTKMLFLLLSISNQLGSVRLSLLIANRIVNNHLIIK